MTERDLRVTCAAQVIRQVGSVRMFWDEEEKNKKNNQQNSQLYCQELQC